MLKAVNKKSTARQRWLAVHLYLGLLLGLIISIVGLSGSLLVFYVELDEYLNPELSVAHSGQARLSSESLFQALLKAEPGRQRSWRLEIPEASQQAMTARYYKPAETTEHGFAPLLVSVDPYTGEILQRRFWGQFAMTWLYDLHYTLLLDQPGKIIMAILGGGLLLSLFSGVYLWWPKVSKLKTALTLKAKASRERFNYDLHKLAGVYSLLIMLVLTVTGIALEIPQYVNPILGFFSPLHSQVKPHSVLPVAGRQRISLDQAVSVGLSVFNDARVCWIETPDGELGSYRINLRQPGEPSMRFPKTNVWVDQYDGHVLAINDPKTVAASDTLISWFHPLHSGEALALPGRLLVFVTGLMCPLLFVTGVIRWRQKCRVRG